MTELLTLRSVSKSYVRGHRRLPVLSDLSLDLRAGEITAIVGSKHDGKTTLLKVAAGIERPDAGEVLFGGTDLARCSDAQRAQVIAEQVGWAQASGQGIRAEVLEHLTTPLLLGGHRGLREATGLAMAALERVGAAECAKAHWRDLSNWERLLVALARAIVNSPRVIFLDDVLEGMGLLRAQQAGDLLLSLVREWECAVLLSACDHEGALCADRVFTLDRGGLMLMSDQARGEAEVIEFPLVPPGGRASGRVS